MKLYCKYYDIDFQNCWASNMHFKYKVVKNDVKI